MESGQGVLLGNLAAGFNLIVTSTKAHNKASQDEIHAYNFQHL